MKRFLPSALFVTGMLLICVAAWSYWTQPGGTLVIEPPNLELSDAPVGQPLVVSFTLRNTSRETIRIVGLAPC